MTIKHSTQNRRPAKPKKPAKPSKSYPLFPHAVGQWAKKIKGRTHYFGVWSDPDAAIEKWLHEKDFLLAGKTPPPMGETFLTVKELCNQFLAGVERKVATGERSDKTLNGYIKTSKQVADCLGRTTPVESLTPPQFAKLRAALGFGVGLKTLEGRIAEARAIFNYGDKNGLFDVPLRKLWGTEFDKPSKTVLKKERNTNGTRELSAVEVNLLIKAASPALKAMILLGLNCGFGNSDCGNLKIENIKNGFVELSRSKTGKLRRCPLWKETQQALQAVIGDRSTGLVFVTKYGNSWSPHSRENKKGNVTYTDPIAAEFAKLRTKAGITGSGKSFYTLRHQLQTVADETLDFVAVQFIMGHDDSSISGHYRERITDKRLQLVTDHVRAWLFNSKTNKK